MNSVRMDWMAAWRVAAAMDVGEGAGPPLVGNTVGVPGLLQICDPQASPELCLQMGRAPCRGVASDAWHRGCGWCVAVVDGGPEIAEPLGGWLGERAVEEERKGKEGLPFTRTRGLLAYWRGPISEDARRLLGRESPHLRGR